MRKITLAEFRAELKAQGVERDHLALVCPMCGTVQSAKSLIAAGAGADFEEVEKYLGFSCVGRFTGAGGENRTKGKGCDWTLGGLFHLHKLEVITEDGTHHPRFEVATPEEAKELANVQ